MEISLHTSVQMHFVEFALHPQHETYLGTTNWRIQQIQL